MKLFQYAIERDNVKESSILPRAILLVTEIDWDDFLNGAANDADAEPVDKQIIIAQLCMQCRPT